MHVFFMYPMLTEPNMTQAQGYFVSEEVVGAQFSPQGYVSMPLKDS